MSAGAGSRRWSWRIGSFFGIDVFVHTTFFLLLAGMGLYTLITMRSGLEALRNVTYMIAVFACVLLHEFGHALMAKLHGIQTREVMLLPIGGVARLERMPKEPWQEFLIASAGPAVNLVLAGLFCGIAWGMSDGSDSAATQILDAILRPISVDATDAPEAPDPWIAMLRVNLLLGMFNLLPGFPMDGGRIVRAMLASLLDYSRATRWAANVGAVVSLGLSAYGFFQNEPLLILVGLFVFMSGRQEAAAAAAQILLRGITVRTAMTTHFVSVPTYESLEHAASLLLRTSQHDFPMVGDDGRYLGLLTRSDLLSQIEKRGRYARVIDAARRGIETLSPEDLIENVLERHSGSPPHALPVVEEGRVVGLLTGDGIQKVLWLRESLGREPSASAERSARQAPTSEPSSS
ncbi:MAG: site-2 protease family protein [Planctomycetes bacterium]|nr:site-2 protease family protein [Planctomycetota bacterium]